MPSKGVSRPRSGGSDNGRTNNADRHYLHSGHFTGNLSRLCAMIAQNEAAEIFEENL